MFPHYDTSISISVVSGWLTWLVLVTPSLILSTFQEGSAPSEDSSGASHETSTGSNSNGYCPVDNMTTLVNNRM